MGGLAQFVLFDLAVEGALADAEKVGGLLAVAGGEAKGLGDVVLLDVGHGSAQQGGGVGSGAGGGVAMFSTQFFHSRTLPGQS